MGERTRSLRTPACRYVRGLYHPRSRWKRSGNARAQRCCDAVEPDSWVPIAGARRGERNRTWIVVPCVAPGGIYGKSLKYRQNCLRRQSLIATSQREARNTVGIQQVRTWNCLDIQNSGIYRLHSRKTLNCGGENEGCLEILFGPLVVGGLVSHAIFGANGGNRRARGEHPGSDRCVRC